MEHIKPSTATTPFPEGLSPRIEDAIKSFSCISEAPVTFFDNAGDIKWECNSDKKICNYFDVYHTKNSICTDNLMSSANVASKLGEPYVFVCRAGFVKIAVSLIIKGEVVGCFMAGPVAMGKISESILTNIFNINSQNIVPETFSKLTIFLRSMKTFTPKDVAYMSNLLNCCVLSSIAQNEDYSRINNQFKEQAKIGEDIQNLKKQNKTVAYPYKSEKELIIRIKNGDSKGAQEIMQTLLNDVLVLEAGNIELVKTRMLEIYAVLSRAAIEDDASLQKTFGTKLDYINSLNESKSINELRQWTTELIDHFSRDVFESMYSGSSQIIGQAVQLIRENYMNKISLEKIANSLYINQSYLSMHFKHEMGVTFTDYLNDVRIKVSKDLLSTTNLSLLDISLHSGFEDQSYFTKVFKKFEDCTPKEYRKLTQRSMA